MSSPLPEHVARPARHLAELPGVEAVVLGGSRATGTHRPDSDWDLGLYYRASTATFDPADVRHLGYEGHVSGLGEWGPVVNGGGWLTVDDTHVDVLFRELDTIERWRDEAERGRFEVLTQAGCLVGAPTYLPVGELAVCLPIAGEINHPAFPAELAAHAPTTWYGQASLSLLFAEGYAGLGDAVCCAGMLTRAVLCTAHGTLARRREWVLNEKRLVERAGLQQAQSLLAHPGTDSAELAETVTRLRQVLDLDPTVTR